MFNKILVAIDTEQSCELLFEKALKLGQATTSDLILLGVLVPGSDGTLPLMPYPEMVGYPSANMESSWKLYHDRYNAYKEKGLATLSSYLDRAIAAGVQAELRQEVGEPGEVICKVAKAENIELIVIGSHGRRGLDELLMGSVSSYVMHRAPCSVLVDRQSVVQEPAEEPTKAVQQKEPVALTDS